MKKGELGLAVGAQVTNLCAEGSRAVGTGDGRRVGGRVVDAQFLCFPLHFCFMLVPLCCPVGNKMYVTMC